MYIYLNKLIFAAGKCIGKVDSSSIEPRSNVFYELSEVQNSVAVTASILINGQRCRVVKHMAYTHIWIQTHYHQAFHDLLGRI